MPTPLKLISSMATRALLADLAAAWQAEQPDAPLLLEAAGGVDAAKRVAAGEVFDVVALARNAIDSLVDSGHVLADSPVDLVHSGVAVAVRAGAALPDIASEAAVQQAVLAASSVGYSTGPSGTALLKLFERWGIMTQLQGRLVQARPGVPVGQSVASGEVALGFQQLSELVDLPGITVVGPLPPAIQIDTVFSGGVAATSTRPERVRQLLAFMADARHGTLKQRHGMTAA